jgi:hypothetical protein
VISVPAGANLTAEWHHGLNTANTGDPSDPIDSSHKGPVITYMAKVDSATQTTVTGLKWFKIQQEGYDATTGKWGVDRMIANAGKYSFVVPKCIPSGQYLIRHELIGDYTVFMIYNSNLSPMSLQLFMRHQATQELSSTWNAPKLTLSMVAAHLHRRRFRSLALMQVWSHLFAQEICPLTRCAQELTLASHSASIGHQ